MVTNAQTPPDVAGVSTVSANGTAAPGPATGRWVLLATILGSSMAFIDGTVVNVALPVLQQQLGATQAAVQWVVQAYALFLAALILVGGALGDRLGRKRVFAVGVAIFTLASIGCGFAPNVEVLIAARALQGVGGALLVPGSLALITGMFHDEQARGRAIGTWSGATAITSAIGPVLGGWLVEYASWRWVFLINVPVAAVVLAVTVLRVPESRDPDAAGGWAGVDWWGALLATLGLGGIVFGFTAQPDLGWGDPVVLGCLAGGVAAFVAFLFVEARGRAPMMPLNLFRSRSFAGANGLTLLLYAALGGALFFVPFNLIQVQRYSPTAAGAALLPTILILSVLSRWAGGLVGTFGAKLPLIVGPLTAGAGFLLFARTGVGGDYWTTFFPAAVALGLGLAVTVAPLTATVMGAVDERHAGVASGINNAVSRAAGVLAIAVFGIVAATAFGPSLAARLAETELSAETAQAIEAGASPLGGAPVPEGTGEEQATVVRQAAAAAFVDGFRWVMLVAAGLAIASAVVALLLIDGKRAAPAGG